MNKSIKLESGASRAVLLLAVLFCLAATFFAVKWYFGNAIAVRSPNKEVAELSVSFAPNDPQTHYTLAVFNEKDFVSSGFAESLAEFERATALAPYDFRLWLALGKARERNGDVAGAELALRKAFALAPNYAAVQWTLGNFLLRRGNVREAFEAIRQAAAGDAGTYKNSALTTAWRIFDGDLAAVKQNLGDSAQLNAALAVFLAGQKRFDEALAIWNALPSEQKKTSLKPDGETLFAQLTTEKRYRDALLVRQSINEPAEAAADFAAGKIFNGDFEIEVKRENSEFFDWQIAPGVQPQIGFDDAQKHAGNRSLVIIFNSQTGREFRQVSQTTAVDANRKYTFELFYKSDLKTASPLRWEVVDAGDGKILGTTDAVSNNADWTNLKVDFIASANTQAVTFRLARDTCKSIVCPIAGKVWFDDFTIN